jgi:hypothetical protein
MNEIMQNLVSGSWWFSVVLAGVLVNILAVVLKTAANAWLSKFSTKRRSVVERRRAEQTQTVAVLKSDPYQQLMFDLREVKALVTGVLYVVLGQTLIVAAAVMNLRDLIPKQVPRTALGAGWDVLTAYALGAVLIVMGMISLREAVVKGFMLRQARSGDTGSVRGIST